MVAVLLIPVLPARDAVGPAVQIDTVVGIVTVGQGDDVVINGDSHAHLDGAIGVTIITVELIIHTGIRDVGHLVAGYVPYHGILYAGHSVINIDLFVHVNAVLETDDLVPGHGPGHVHGRSVQSDHVVIAPDACFAIYIDGVFRTVITVTVGDRLQHVVVDRYVHIYPYPRALSCLYIVVQVDTIDILV